MLELELWSLLSSLALRQQDYTLVRMRSMYGPLITTYLQVSKCTDKALEFVNIKGNKAALKIHLSRYSCATIVPIITLATVR